MSHAYTCTFMYIYVYFHIVHMHKFIHVHVCAFMYLNSYLCMCLTYVKNRAIFFKCIRVYIHVQKQILHALCMYTCQNSRKSARHSMYYGVATISRLLKITGLFCRIQSLLQGSFANGTYHFKEPTNRSHPFCDL